MLFKEIELIPNLEVRVTKAEVPVLLAGALRGCDPDRVVIKKVVLSGYPVRVHKKKAVVRWMFFNPEDVRWFRPLELWTKHGRRGRIKASVPCCTRCTALVLCDFCNSCLWQRLSQALPCSCTLTLSQPAPRGSGLAIRSSGYLPLLSFVCGVIAANSEIARYVLSLRSIDGG